MIPISEECKTAATTLKKISRRLSNSMFAQMVQGTFYRLREERVGRLAESKGRSNIVASGSQSGCFIASAVELFKKKE